VTYFTNARVLSESPLIPCPECYLAAGSGAPSPRAWSIEQVTPFISEEALEG
jgi:hypothetical protein